MKVLYLSSAAGADYLNDMIFHGLRTLLGPDCVDVNKLTFMYQGANPPFHSIYALLPDIPVDREDISGKLRAHYFDIVIYGSIQRFSEHLLGVQECYPPNRIAYIDGEDDWSTVYHSCMGRGLYFKRELTPEHHPAMLPIEFCIPHEKLWTIDKLDATPKIHVMSPLVPGDYATYTYYGPDGEERYYRQYAQSWFARTRRKGGWDACRHYEIMAAGAMPYFENLEACPKQTLNWMPKDTLLMARLLCDEWDGRPEQRGAYLRLWIDMRKILRERLTTVAMAHYVIDTMLST